MALVKPATLAQPDRTGSASAGAVRSFRTDIEGLRAVAVLAVVLFHADVPGVGGGYIGVDVFFVISGFLITGLLWREVAASGSIRLPRFYGARARRLLPASAVVGVATAIGSALLLDPLQARQAFLDAISCALYVGNYGFALQGTDYLSAAVPPSPFQHYWSLGVEEQFYLAWAPLILAVTWLLRRARNRSEVVAAQRYPYLIALAVVGAGSFAASLVMTQAAPSWAFFSLPTRGWELAAGGLVALTADYWRRLPGIRCHDRRVGRCVGDTAGMHPARHRYTISGHGRSGTRAGRSIRDCRGLCCNAFRCRSRAVGVTDARGRQAVVLVVSLALASPAARTPFIGTRVGSGSQADSGRLVGCACSRDVVRGRKPVTPLDAGSGVGRPQSWAGRRSDRSCPERWADNAPGATRPGGPWSPGTGTRSYIAAHPTR